MQPSCDQWEPSDDEGISSPSRNRSRIVLNLAPNTNLARQERAVMLFETPILI